MNKTPTAGKIPGKIANPLAIILNNTFMVLRKMASVIFGSMTALAVISILVGIRWISVELMLILLVGTIVTASFKAGVIWQRLFGR